MQVERTRMPASGPSGWEQAALCAQTDPEAFFPETGQSAPGAKAVCRACPVQGECLESALANDERFGVWGGLSEQERRELAERRAGQTSAEGAALVATGVAAVAPGGDLSGGAAA
jgi:WhiB family transcriptional regulator, redox-sensing transcriptional regulator